MTVLCFLSWTMLDVCSSSDSWTFSRTRWIKRPMLDLSVPHQNALARSITDNHFCSGSSLSEYSLETHFILRLISLTLPCGLLLLSVKVFVSEKSFVGKEVNYENLFPFICSTPLSLLTVFGLAKEFRRAFQHLGEAEVSRNEQQNLEIGGQFENAPSPFFFTRL